MFEALKSRYITGLSASCRKVRPLAAPNAIFILVDHGMAAEYSVRIRTKEAVIKPWFMVRLQIFCINMMDCQFVITHQYPKKT